MRDGRTTRVGKVTYAAQSSPLLDCRLIALSFAVNLFGKSRVRRRLQAADALMGRSRGDRIR